MSDYDYVISVSGEDEAASNRATGKLIEMLIGIDGVGEIHRGKSDEDTMDLGTIVSVVAGSGATLALAQGVAVWLKARRGVKIKVERRHGADSLVTEVEGIDPQTARQIIEHVS